MSPAKATVEKKFIVERAEVECYESRFYVENISL